MLNCDNFHKLAANMINHIKGIALRSGCTDPVLLDDLLKEIQPGGRSAIRVLLDSQIVDED